MAAAKIGYGAVKYFDLKQHPATNYIFSYDRMLDTKGDTAVYLLFAYARLASILRKVRLLRGDYGRHC
jgi:arginyl-tRNA synthetase